MRGPNVPPGSGRPPATNGGGRRTGELQTLLGKKGPSQGGFSAGETRRTLLLLTFVPWTLCSVVVFLFLVAYRSAPDFFLLLVGLGLLLCVRQAFVNYMRGGSDGAYAMALCSLAIVVGTMAGLHNYRTTLRHYWALDEGRVYDDVGPGALADAHRDAAALTFVGGVKPDTQASTGYSEGYVTYCVAPIGSWDAATGSGQIQFWAAGKDCCSSHGNFACDDALSVTAKGGLVIDDADVPNYILAVRTAEAVNGAHSVPRPIFLRWVKDFELARGEYLTRAWLYWIMVTAIYLPLSAALVVLAPSSLKSIDMLSGEKKRNAAPSQPNTATGAVPVYTTNPGPVPA